MHLARSQRNLTDNTSPAFSAGRKLSEMEQALLWSVLHFTQLSEAGTR